MADSEDAMDQIVEQLIVNLPYLGVVLVLLAGGFGMPIPEDLPLLAGGYLCGRGHASVLRCGPGVAGLSPE